VDGTDAAGAVYVFTRSGDAWTQRAELTAPTPWNTADPVPGCGHTLVRLSVLDARGRVLTRASTLPVTTNASHTVRVRTAGLAPGTYRVAWRAVGAAGNVQRGVTHGTLTVR